jgi:hypothetical protein
MKGSFSSVISLVKGDFKTTRGRRILDLYGSSKIVTSQAYSVALERLESAARENSEAILLPPETTTHFWKIFEKTADSRFSFARGIMPYFTPRCLVTQFNDTYRGVARTIEGEFYLVNGLDFLGFNQRDCDQMIKALGL